MTDAEFLEKLERAAAVVREWPIWKRHILLQSLQPSSVAPLAPEDIILDKPRHEVVCHPCARNQATHDE